MQRTVRLELRPAPEQAESLAETTRQYTEAFNHVCRYGWQEREQNGVTLHHETYYGLRQSLPNLPANVLIQARVKATEAVKSALTLAKKGRKVGCPRSSACAVRFNERTCRLDWSAAQVSLSTVTGRVLVAFLLPEYAAQYRDLPVTTADLLFRKGRWWLHVVVNVPMPEVTPSAAVVGIDLGLRQPAVTSTGKFLGKRCWRGQEAKYFRHKRALQQRGTKSATRRLKKTSGRQQRFRRNCDHLLSKQVVQSCPEGGTLVLENLTHLRQRIKTRKGPQSRRVHGWSFAQLFGFVSYKAEERGVTVVAIDPRHTSQRCSRCGHTARNNRRSRSVFRCRSCDFELHADLNGARNIAAKYHAGDGKSAPSGSLSEDLQRQPSLPSNGVCSGLGASLQPSGGGI